MQRKIVADSSADLLTLSAVPFESAPLKIITSQNEYVDDAALDIGGMVDDLQRYKGRSSTSCPNANDWLETFGDADEVFCFTITGTLSGSYNAALMAKQLYEAEHPDRRNAHPTPMSVPPRTSHETEATRKSEGNSDFSEISREVLTKRGRAAAAAVAVRPGVGSRRTRGRDCFPLGWRQLRPA